MAAESLSLFLLLLCFGRNAQTVLLWFARGLCAGSFQVTFVRSFYQSLPFCGNIEFLILSTQVRLHTRSLSNCCAIVRNRIVCVPIAFWRHHRSLLCLLNGKRFSGDYLLWDCCRIECSCRSDVLSVCQTSLLNESSALF